MATKVERTFVLDPKTAKQRTNLNDGKLVGSVGLGGWNREDDVAKVQTMLRKVRFISVGNLEVDGKCGTTTISAIRMFQIHIFDNPWMAEWCDGRVDPKGPTLRFLRAAADDTEIPTELFSIRIPGTLQPIQQIGPTCWAAAAVMMRGWKSGARSMNVRDEIARIGQEWLETYDFGNGLPLHRHQDFATAAGMRYIAPSSQTIATFRKLLAKPSPVYVAANVNDDKGAHARVIIGMFGDGTSLGTRVVMHDTAYGEEYDMLFAVFAWRMASLTTSAFYSQLLHF